MKKTLLALAVLSAISGVASAQSSVTLSGILDAGIRRTGTATGYDWGLGGSQSGYNSFTISGREDLGGGMSAFFVLNHRFAINNGTINSSDFGIGTSFPQCVAPITPATAPSTAPCSSTAPISSPTFWRNAWVGLGGAFGDVRLGRILMPLQDMNGGFDPFDTGTVGTTHTGGITATIRANNAIYYRSPNISGLTVHAAIAAGEGQLQFETRNNPGPVSTSSIVPTSKLVGGGGGQRPVGFNIRYAAGPLNVGAAYDRNFANFKTKAIYGSFNFGFMTLMGQYEDGDSNIGTATVPEQMKAMSIGAKIPLGPVLIRAGYVRFDSDRNTCTGAGVATGGTRACDASKFGFGGDYALSKRTYLYSNVGKFSGDRLSAATKKAMFDIGVNHRF